MLQNSEPKQTGPSGPGRSELETVPVPHSTGHAEVHGQPRPEALRGLFHFLVYLQ